jgi:hypothetical protein
LLVHRIDVLHDIRNVKYFWMNGKSVLIVSFLDCVRVAPRKNDGKAGTGNKIFLMK